LTHLQTHRLILRQWCESDIEPFSAMNRCDQVMKYFPRHYSAEESENFVAAMTQHIEQFGWGNWAVEVPGVSPFIGYVGLSEPATWHPCANSIEIGWRLSSNYWKQGYATEAARQVLHYGFEQLELPEIISFTAKSNTPSLAVMQRIGLRHNGESFEHPRIADDDPLRHHLVYRLLRGDYLRNCPE